MHEALSRKLRNANMAVAKAAGYARLYALQVGEEGRGRGVEGGGGVDMAVTEAAGHAQLYALQVGEGGGSGD